MLQSAPILFFDSGVGGLSVAEAARSVLPQAPFVYAADSAGFPYGTKSEDEIAARVPTLLGRLTERFRPCLVVIACNTASTIALAHVRAALAVPVVGTVPAIKPAALASKSRVIGVLGTAATVRQPYVDRLAGEHARDCRVIRHGSSALVDLAEAKLRGAGSDPGIIARELDPFRGTGLDQLVLACTHFPLLREELAAALPGVALVDSGAGIARRIKVLTAGQAWPASPPPGIALFTGAIDETLRAALSARGFPELRSL